MDDLNESAFERSNRSRDMSKMTGWDVPMPALEVLQRRVFANLRPAGSEPPPGKPKSGDPAFDAMLERITKQSSR